MIAKAFVLSVHAWRQRLLRLHLKSLYLKEAPDMILEESVVGQANMNDIASEMG